MPEPFRYFRLLLSSTHFPTLLRVDDGKTAGSASAVGWCNRGQRSGAVDGEGENAGRSLRGGKEQRGGRIDSQRDRAVGRGKWTAADRRKGSVGAVEGKGRNVVAAEVSGKEEFPGFQHFSPDPVRI